jgi:hypothetical protein
MVQSHSFSMFRAKSILNALEELKFILQQYLFHFRRNYTSYLSSDAITIAQKAITQKTVSQKSVGIRYRCTAVLNRGVCVQPWNTKGGSITVLLTSCLTGLESAVWQMTIFVFIC